MTYEDLKTALDNTGIPFAECEWATRPTGDYGTYQMEFEAWSDSGDDRKLNRDMEGSIHLYMKGGRKKALIRTVENALQNTVGATWERNREAYENQTRMYHIEWVWRLQEEIGGDADGDDDEGGGAGGA